MESPSIGNGRNEEMRKLDVAIWKMGTGDKRCTSSFKLQVELELEKKGTSSVCLF